MDAPKQIWVCEALRARDNDGTEIPAGNVRYYFHCPFPEKTPGGFRQADGSVTYGKAYLYSATQRNFVTTTDPAIAVLIQQMLNDGNLTIKPFTTETK